MQNQWMAFGLNAVERKWRPETCFLRIENCAVYDKEQTNERA
jgi:hypothetical protein